MNVEFTQTWQGANALCISASSGRATLTSIHSQEENEHVYSLFSYKAGLNAWLGGYLDSTGAWAWLDGSPFDYSNWATGAPNETAPQRIMMYGKTGSEPEKWNTEAPTNGVVDSVCSHTP